MSDQPENQSSQGDDLSKPGLFQNFANVRDEAIWSGVFLIFLAFFYFQGNLYNEFYMGYFPFRERGWEFPVTYPFRSTLAGFLFGGLLLWLSPKPFRIFALIFLLIMTTLLFSTKLAPMDQYEFANDRSEALSNALTYLFDGEFPYQQDEWQPVTPLTTTLILAVPGHVLFKRPDLMTIPLLVLGFFILAWRRWRARSAIPAEILAAAVFLNPVVAWELIWGSDLLWGPILLIGALALLDEKRVRWAALVFALAICTRSSFFLLLPLWGIYVWRRHRAQFWSSTSIVIVTTAVLELPFALWDPNTFFGYAPFGVSNLKFSLESIPKEHAVGDLLNLILPAGAWRAAIVSIVLLCFSGLLSRWATDSGRLALCSAILFSFMLVFIGGRHFLIDYICWVLFPLFFVLVSYSANPAISTKAES